MKPQDSQAPAIVEGDDGINVRELIGVVLENGLWVIAAVVLSLLVGAYIAYTESDVYQAQALVQVERQKSLFEDSLAIGPQQPQSSAQVEILKSRSVIGAAVRELNLNLDARPVHLGRLGAAMARGYQGERPAAPPLQWLPLGGLLDGYAWGGERIDLGRLEVPDALLGVPLTLRAEGDKRFALLAPGARTLLTGTAGQVATADYAGGEVRIFVAALKARPGTHFTVVNRPIGGVVSSLRSRLEVTETGRQSGVLDISYTAGSQQQAQTQLDAITEAYLRQNVERQNEQSRQTLSFLQEQLPNLKEEVDTAQSKLRDYQEREGSVDLSLEAQGLLGQVSDIEQQLSELELKESELLQEYTAEHPTVQSVRRARSQLQQERREIESKLQKLPEREAQFLELSRDAKVANELYVQLLNRAQELEVTKAGTTGFVHIVDSAYASGQPVWPKTSRIMLLALAAGLILGLGLAFLRDALRLTLRDPDVIEQKVGLPVYATIPYSRTQSRLAQDKRQSGILALTSQDDLALEALRSLRTSLQFALMEAGSPVVCITSPAPGAGKSFVSSNLALLVGELGKRVLLVDADMRRGHIHRAFGLSRSPGLSDIVTGEVSPESVIHRVAEERMDFLSGGTIPPNPSELLLNPRFRNLLQTWSEQYDLVLIDTPPLLSVTDGVIVAEQSGTTLLVGRYNQTRLHEIDTATKRLRQSGARLSGLVFNAYRPGVSRYAYGKYGYHAYRYGSG
ncbi:polysaccharide biosynthesis tyrosine autokinase [Salinisphaera sp. P385]|uniref:Polysaccharide biosynthesis tyrosine autokinase n=1 Tax=Spectribacter acetivorans TaxID=3075603 RepID=A0ABU3BBP5_9GAMM|nr:polysaccharide biosynthesis tyrosine autokinase [Salinisphaera sp. P385]MDT0619879.1 polysaccharide biosynthesis tyrosine autokinase [Salinisphaera sp. P385]